MHSIDDFVREINTCLKNQKPLNEKFELAELVKPNVVILLPPPQQKLKRN